MKLDGLIVGKMIGDICLFRFLMDVLLYCNRSRMKYVLEIVYYMCIGVSVLSCLK